VRGSQCGRPACGDGDPPKTVNEVITDFDVEPALLTVLERKPAGDPSTSFSASYREAIELRLSRGRNSMVIWQDSRYNHGGVIKVRLSLDSVRRPHAQSMSPDSIITL
jgi:hypothetical protein